MDIQDKLKRDYENKSIYTAGFYADPDNDLANRKKLFDVLKSLVEKKPQRHLLYKSCLQMAKLM